MPLVRLQSCDDGSVHELDAQGAVRLSGFLKSMIEDFGLVPIEDDNPIQLPITGVVLRKVVEWCRQHVDDDETAEWDKCASKSTISAWDKSFVKKVDRKTLLDIIKAANYLNIEGLLHVACVHLASSVCGTAAEVRSKFKITK